MIFFSRLKLTETTQYESRIGKRTKRFLDRTCTTRHESTGTKIIVE